MLTRKTTLLLLALAAAASLAPACSTKVDATGSSSGSTGSGGAGGAAGCPANAPLEGTSCVGPASSVSCHYPAPCCADSLASCIGGAWKVTSGPCTGKTPANPCPGSPPQPGESCAGSCDGPRMCFYGACPGSTQFATQATCLGTWSIMTTACPDAGSGGAGGGGDTDGGAPAGGACGQSADGGACAAGLACCYPCGIPGCPYTCTTPCAPSMPGCSNGCPELP
jgi:hypothetical protein